MMKKVNSGVLMLISVLLIAIAGVVYFILLGQWHTTAFAAGRTNTVKVYSYGAEAAADTDKSPGLTECGEVIRGSEVTRYSQSVTEGGVTYHKVKVKAAELWLYSTTITARPKPYQMR